MVILRTMSSTYPPHADSCKDFSSMPPTSYFLSNVKENARKIFFFSCCGFFSRVFFSSGDDWMRSLIVLDWDDNMQDKRIIIVSSPISYMRDAKPYCTSGRPIIVCIFVENIMWDW